MKIKCSLFIVILSSYLSPLNALTFQIRENSDIIGKIQTATVQANESLGDIGRRFDIGLYEMIEANPNLNPWAPKMNATVIVPSEFILPVGKHEGMTINLAEMRIYYFHPEEKLVTTHPIGIGVRGWLTPLGYGHVIGKREMPHWRPPQSIRTAHALKGDPLPEIVPPGPDNPLGEYAMRLSIPGYLIHGTNRPGGVGVRSSKGCIRMFPEDIKSFYPIIKLGTPVRIIHAPYKFGQHGYNIFLEAHIPLSDPYYQADNSQAAIEQALAAITTEEKTIDWTYAQKAIDQSRGYPILIR